MYDLPNGSVSSELGWSLTYISRSRVIIDAVDVLRAQLTRDLFAIAKFFSQSWTSWQINAFWKEFISVFSCELIQLETLTSAADKRLFAKMCGEVHCLHSLLSPAMNCSLKHRPRVTLLNYRIITMILVVKVAFEDACMGLNSFCCSLFVFFFVFFFVSLL